jgi:hypothetical protein
MDCFCGCSDPPVHLHHCVTKQEITRVHRTLTHEGKATRPLKVMLDDERNLVPVAFVCHGSHHAASQRYELGMLPDSVFEFAAEVLGRRAFGVLRRCYVGEDSRLDALLAVEAVA